MIVAIKPNAMATIYKDVQDVHNFLNDNTLYPLKFLVWIRSVIAR